VPPMLSEWSDVIRFSLMWVSAANVVGVAMTTLALARSRLALILTIFGDFRRLV